MATCKTCGAPVNLAPDGDPKYEAPPTLRAQLAEANAKLAVAVGALDRCVNVFEQLANAGNYPAPLLNNGGWAFAANIRSTLPARAAQMLAVVAAAQKVADDAKCGAVGFYIESSVNELSRALTDYETTRTDRSDG